VKSVKKHRDIPNKQNTIIIVKYSVYKVLKVLNSFCSISSIQKRKGEYGRIIPLSGRKLFISLMDLEAV